MQVQDIRVHFAVLLICAVSVAAAIVQLVETFDPHTWQSISVLVSPPGATIAAFARQQATDKKAAL